MKYLLEYNNIEIISKIIDENNNIEDLIKLKSYLTNEFLNQDLAQFIKHNIIGDKAFKRRDLLNGVVRINKLERNPKVIDSIGIGKTKLSRQPKVGEYTTEKYESLLNLYGYSLEKLSKKK